MIELTPFRHASIDPAVRAARGLPEDLIRLCVGIEDLSDLLDDLRHALLEAGAITMEQGVDGHHYIRASVQREGRAISRAVEKLAFNEQERPKKDTQEWFVSAPGKVILFGEHAVVHGVVSFHHMFSLLYTMLTSRGRLLWQHPWTYAAMVIQAPVMTTKSQSPSSTSGTTIKNGTSTASRGTLLHIFFRVAITQMSWTASFWMPSILE